MSKLKELREKSARAIAEARSLIDALKTDSTAEARAEAHRQADAFLTEAQGHDTESAMLERLEAAEQRARSFTESQRPIIEGRQGEERKKIDDEEYREAFRQLAIVGGHVGELSEEHREVVKRGAAMLPMEARTQLAGTNTAGGYTTPIQLANFIIEHIAATGPMFNSDIVTVLDTSSGVEYDIPTLDDTATDVYDSVEGAALTDDGSKDLVVGQRKISAFMIDSGFVKISPVLIQDSPFGWDGIVGKHLGMRLGKKANTKLTLGTGISGGIVSATSVGKTTAAIAAVTADEILDFYHSVDPNYRKNPKSRIMFNDAVLLALRKLKDGQGNYLIRDGKDFADVLTVGAVQIPYSINQAMLGLGTGNRFMVFGDFSEYYVRKVGGIVTGMLRERFWPNVGIAAYTRFDGQIGNAQAIKVMKNA